MSSEGSFEDKVRHRLLIGQKREDVEEVLRQFGVGFSYVERERKLYGITPMVRRNLILHESTSIIASFDERDRLINLDIAPVYTGP